MTDDEELGGEERTFMMCVLTSCNGNRVSIA